MGEPTTLLPSSSTQSIDITDSPAGASDSNASPVASASSVHPPPPPMSRRGHIQHHHLLGGHQQYNPHHPSSMHDHAYTSSSSQGAAGSSSSHDLTAALEGMLGVGGDPLVPDNFRPRRLRHPNHHQWQSADFFHPCSYHHPYHGMSAAASHGSGGGSGLECPCSGGGHHGQHEITPAMLGILLLFLCRNYSITIIFCHTYLFVFCLFLHKYSQMKLT